MIGHVAAFPVKIGDGTTGWFGIRSVAVGLDLQEQGVGSTLLERVLEALRESGAGRIVLPGDPEFHSRFGFRAVEGLAHPDAPPEHFPTLPLSDSTTPQARCPTIQRSPVEMKQTDY